MFYVENHDVEKLYNLSKAGVIPGDLGERVKVKL